MNNFEFITAKKVVCEIGAARRLAEFCSALGVRRPMLVTDPGLVRAGIAADVERLLTQAGIAPLLYSDVQADPAESLVLDCASLARSERVDGVIGLGGGSSLDVAKLVAVLAVSEQPLSQMYGIGNVRGERLPLLLIATTAGTGSEVTPTSIITTGETTKAGVIAAQLLPDIAVLDAELTLGLPAHVTAATGIDAMVHAIEAYTSRYKKNIYSDMLAREALRLMSENILEAVHNGANLQARAKMLLGAMMAGQSFANAPVAAVHALAYPLGGNYHIPHGLSNSLVLPHVLRFNAPSAAGMYEELLPSIAAVVPGDSAAAGCELFIESIDALITAVELPKTLRELAVPETDLPRLAEEAMLQQRLLVNNPRELGVDDALAIYRQAY